MFLQRVTNPLYVCTATILCPEALYTVLENGKHFARDGTYHMRFRLVPKSSTLDDLELL